VGCPLLEAKQSSRIVVEGRSQVSQVVNRAPVPATKVCAKHEPVDSELCNREFELGFTADMAVEPKPVHRSIKGPRFLDPLG